MDFLNTVFTIILVAFCIFYFIAGDRFGEAEKIMKMILPLAYFGILFLIRMKFNQRRLRKLYRESNLDEIITYLTLFDKIRDTIIIASLPLIILFIAFIDKIIHTEDYLQAGLVFALMYAWHLYLFRQRDKSRPEIYVTALDRILDEIVILLLSIIILSLALINKDVDMVDVLQAFSVLGVLYIRHHILFKSE